MTTGEPAGSAFRTEAAWVLPIGVALIALAWLPPIPLAGAQLSDGIAASGIALVLASIPGMARWIPSRAGAIAAAAYAAWALISTLATDGNKLRLLGTWWLVVLGLGTAAFAAASEVHTRRIRRALIAAALVGAVTGLVGALLFAFGTPTGLLNHAGDLVPGDYPRIRGTMMRANALAGLLAVGVVLVVDDPAPRRTRIVVIIVLLAALVFTFSRTWIALLAAIATYAALGTKRSASRTVIAIATVVVCIAAMLAVSWLGIRLDPTRPWDLAITDEPGTRWHHLRAALETLAAHPLTGIGPGGWADPTGWDAHFTLANIGALTGIPGVLAFLAVIGIAFHHARGDRALIAILVLFCIDGLARDIEDQRALWIVIGLAFSSRRLHRSRPSDHPAPAP